VYLPYTWERPWTADVSAMAHVSSNEWDCPGRTLWQLARHARYQALSAGLGRTKATIALADRVHRQATRQALTLCEDIGRGLTARADRSVGLGPD
jgi:hypothetical protein